MKFLSAVLIPATALLVCYTSVDALTRPSSIRFEDNEYTGVVVAIHNQIEEDENLVERIKYMVTEGSKYLYQATNGRAYFREVTILVPKTWSQRQDYQLPGNVTFDYADVIVAPPNPRWAPLPYAKQYQGCGEQGIHIHFMSEFLTDPETETYYGQLGRLFVHEWAHLRWGLFDEYPDALGDPDNYQEFYYSSITQQFEGVRCSYDYNAVPLIFDPASLSFRDCVGSPQNGYEEGCVYYVLQDQTNVNSSIMYGTYQLAPITQFCGDDANDRPNLHNPEAPNKHNRLCKRQSNWEVMRNHQDFKDSANPPIDLTDEQLIPEFTIAQHRDVRVVLVMDRSGSMKDDDKFNKMISSSANYISSIVTYGSYVGIVEFNEDPYVLSDLTLVASLGDREALLASLPDEAEGGTGIGGSVLKAIEVLSAGGGDPIGGIILLISDGEETDEPSILDVMDEVVESGVIVDTLAFTQKAESNMVLFSVNTGGKSYFYSNEPGSNTLYEAFAATMERGDVIDSEKRVQLIGTSWLMDDGERRNDSFFMDLTLGNNTEFSFAWTTLDVLAIDVLVTMPTGEVIDSSYDGYAYDISFRTLTIRIPGRAQEGAWEFSILNLILSSTEVSISISSYPSSDDVEPIIVTSELSGSVVDFELGEPLIAYTEVRQGFSPMIYANVWATIERPGAFDPVRLQLFDEGAEPDITKNDGVYSRYFTEFTEQGYYGIKIEVDNNGGKAIIIESISFSRARAIVAPEDAFNIPPIGGIQVPLPGAQPAEPTGRPAPPFSRGISGGSSRVDEVPAGFVPGDDVFPPSDILDLRITSTSFATKTVSLAWTAPGDDLDAGKASWYELIRADSVLDWESDPTPGAHSVLNSTSILEGNLTFPMAYGTVENYTVLVPIADNATVVSYAFVLRAFDEAGHMSSFSNVVQASLRKFIPVAPVTTVPMVPPAEQKLEGWEIALIVVGCLLLCGLVVAVVYLLICNKSKEGKVEQSPGMEMVKEGSEGRTNPTYA